MCPKITRIFKVVKVSGPPCIQIGAEKTIPGSRGTNSGEVGVGRHQRLVATGLIIHCPL